jgi:hypothetical protein
VPQGEERPTAWLFSLHHLSEADLQAAAERVRDGERPDPGQGLQAGAKKQMGATPLADGAQGPMPTAHLIGIAAANLLLTPLAGFAFWIGLRDERPVAAAQALRITLPIAFALGALWAGMVAMRMLS